MPCIRYLNSPQRITATPHRDKSLKTKGVIDLDPALPFMLAFGMHTESFPLLGEERRRERAMKTALIATLLLVTWPPNWTPNGRQIIESVAYQEKIGSFTITARYDVYNDGTVVTILSHEDISRPIIVLLPTTNRCDSYWADVGVLEKDGVRFRPPPEWDAPAWEWTSSRLPECLLEMTSGQDERFITTKHVRRG